VGLQSTPIRITCGTVSFNISSCLAVVSVACAENPVMLPPGRGRLATCPSPTGSACVAKTIGIVLVACLACSVSTEEVAKVTSTFTRTSSAASGGGPETEIPDPPNLTCLLRVDNQRPHCHSANQPDELPSLHGRLQIRREHRNGTCQRLDRGSTQCPKWVGRKLPDGPEVRLPLYLRKRAQL